MLPRLIQYLLGGLYLFMGCFLGLGPVLQAGQNGTERPALATRIFLGTAAGGCCLELLASGSFSLASAYAPSWDLPSSCRLTVS